MRSTRFVLAKLEKEKLKPAPEADKTTLIRRVTLDLTGLPPTPDEVDAFLADKSPHAYEKVVDRLLASPRYGEHEARYWLDAARYADSHGYHIDSERSMWKYREWVINAFNKNMPFDQFTTEQLAGDLLPEATVEQKIGSGYVRCNHEHRRRRRHRRGVSGQVHLRPRGNDEHDLARADDDLRALPHAQIRSRFMHREYYGLYAIFNNLNESVMDGNKPNPDAVHQSADAGAERGGRTNCKRLLADGRKKLDAPMPELDAKQTDVGSEVAREVERGLDGR